MKITRKFLVTLHWIHASLVTLLLATGIVWFLPISKAMLRDFKTEWIQIHSVLGIFYLLCVVLTIPFVFRYGYRHPRWQKLFHICLQWLLCVGWVSSGVFLWVNPPLWLGLRSQVLLIHDWISWFSIPWILGHLALWLLRKKRERRIVSPDGYQDRGRLLTRREVLAAFGGVTLSFFIGGLFRWFQPISPVFLSGLDKLQKKGYFRIYSVVSENPRFDPATWLLTVDGNVEHKQSYSYEELKQFPKQTYTSDFHCVTGWSVYGVEWTGIPFSTILEQVKPSVEAKFAVFYSADRFYTECYKIDQLREKNVILVYLLDGKPLNENQGAPLRIFHPKMYGYKSLKWLNRIEFTNSFHQGYWEEKEGYDQDGYHV